jgi:hypothetical protein
MQKPVFGDIVATAAIAATAGGFVVGSGMAASLFGIEYLVQSPFEALGGMVMAGFVGMLLALLTAWPAGILIGAFVLRFLGRSTRHAALAGGITAVFLFALAYRDEPIHNFAMIAACGIFAGFGGLLGGLSHRYVMGRGAPFGRN